jgi:excisionase family DNA binding protein
MPRETFYTISDVAKLFGSSELYIRQMANKGEITFSKIGGRYIISHTDLMKEYEAHKGIPSGKLARKEKRTSFYTDKPLRV